MSNGNRGDHTKTGLIAGIIVAVLVASAFIGWGLWKTAEYEREAYDQTREYAAYTDQQIRQSCVSPAPIEKQECAAKARHEQRGNERNEYDLVAQRKSALWAYIMGAAAVIGMGLSVIGVFLVWTTFAETRLANVIARNAAERAAIDAKHSRDALISSERAIIFVRKATQDAPIQPDGLRTAVYFELQNEGKSNAYGFQVFFTPQLEPLYAAKKSRFSFNFDQICAAGGTASCQVIIRTPKRFPVFLIGYVSYSTMGDANFKTYFCFRIDGIVELTATGNLRNTHLATAHCQRLPAMT